MNLKPPFINRLIDNFYILFIFCYIFLMAGVCIKYYFRLPDVKFGAFFPMVVPFVYCLIISIIVFRKLDNISDDDTLNHDEKIERLEHVNDFHEKNVTLNYIKLIIVSLLSFAVGCLVPKFADITLEAITCKILFGFAISIYCIYGIFFISDAKSKIKNSLYGPIIFSFLGIFALGLLLSFDVITSIVAAILNESTDFFILSLTIILLGATLALLAFTYHMVFEGCEKENKIKMRENGEYFFISTIFAIFFLISLFLLSIYFKISNILSLGEISILNLNLFIEVNIFVILLLFILISVCYSIKYLLIGLKSSIDILPFNF